MTETPLPNDEAARTPTGEILDVRDTPKETTPPQETSSESKPSPADTTPSTDAKPSVPEAYSDFTLPEGVTLSKETLEAATPIFKELGLSQEAAQRLVDFHAKQLKSVASAPQETYEKMRSDWRRASESDPDMRGKLGPGAEINTTIGRALDALNDPTLVTDFQSAMNISGVGDNPAFIKTFWRMAQRFAEGQHVAGRNPSIAGQQPPDAKPRTPARSMYPNLP